MRIEEDVKLDYKDVLIRPKRSTLSSRSEVDITRTINFKASKRSITCVPIIAANMDGIGTMAMARAFIPQKMFVALHKYYTVTQLKKFYGSLPLKDAPYVFYTMGVKDTDVAKLDALLKVVSEKRVTSICIDVANGYTERFVEFAKQIRTRFPKKIIMAGNVVTGEIVEELALAGVDIIKVGIGPGSVCTTRKMTGVGYPQLSAVIECADAAHGIGAHICADGGCQVPGDISKAFGGGGDLVMIGSMLAGHAESELERVQQGDVEYVQYCGSSSREAMMKHNGGVAGYRACEGRCVDIPYKGPVKNTLQDILGGLRSACTYVGAKKLKELPKRTTFIRVTQQQNPQYDDYQLNT